MSKSTIIQLCDSPFVGGPEKQILGQCKYIDTASFEFVVASFSMRARKSNKFLAAAQDADLDTTQLSDGKLAFPVAIRQLCLAIKNCNASLVISHGFKANFTAYMASAITGVPYVSYFHGRTGCSAKVKLYEALDIYAMRQANEVVSVCEHAADFLRKNGCKNTRVIPNAIDCDAILIDGTREQARAELKLTDGELAIGAVGRLSVEKGHVYLIDAACEVLREYPNAKFIIIGDGILRAELSSRVKNLGIDDKFIFTGFRKDSTVLMKALDIYVLPSLSENMPVSLMEAMACGISTVATDVGGVDEILHPTLVNPVPPGSSSALSEAILRLAKNENLRKKVGCDLMRRVADFSFQRQSLLIHELISSYR